VDLVSRDHTDAASNEKETRSREQPEP
jgi:hypothetical protein